MIPLLVPKILPCDGFCDAAGGGARGIGYSSSWMKMPGNFGKNKIDRCLARYSPRSESNNAIPCNTMESIVIWFSVFFWAKNGLLQPPWSLLSNMSNIINDKTYMFETDSGVNLLFFLIIDNCYRDMILFHKLFCYWHWWSWWRIWRWLSSWLEVNHSSDLSEWFQLE